MHIVLSPNCGRQDVNSAAHAVSQVVSPTLGSASTRGEQVETPASCACLRSWIERTDFIPPSEGARISICTRVHNKDNRLLRDHSNAHRISRRCTVCVAASPKTICQQLCRSSTGHDCWSTGITRHPTARGSSRDQHQMQHMVGQYGA